MTVRWMAGLLLLGASVGGVACKSGKDSENSGANSDRGPITIAVTDNQFTPSNLTVPPGSKVTWIWKGKSEHAVKGTFAGVEITSPKQATGSWQQTFEKSGTFAYECVVHGTAMSGKVTVGAAD